MWPYWSSRTLKTNNGVHVKSYMCTNIYVCWISIGSVIDLALRPIFITKFISLVQASLSMLSEDLLKRTINYYIVSYWANVLCQTNQTSKNKGRLFQPCKTPDTVIFQTANVHILLVKGPMESLNTWFAFPMKIPWDTKTPLLTLWLKRG